MVKNQHAPSNGAGAVPPSVFGFNIRSSVPLKFLRTGESADSLEIRAEMEMSMPPPGSPSLTWKLQGPSQDVRAELYDIDHRYRYYVSDAGWYDIDPGNGVIRIPVDGDEIMREQRLWGLPTLLCSMHRQEFFLHAAAVEVDGGAVLFAAPGRHGKTTLAMAFHREGYRVLSEDSACCRLTPFPTLLPGPAVLRIRPDVFDGYTPAGAHIVSLSNDRVYLVLDETRKGTDDPIPIKAVIFLRESENEVHLERMAAPKCLPDLWALSFRLPNEASRAQSFLQLSGLASRVPMWNLYRPMRLNSLRKTVAKILNVLPQ